MMSLIKDLRKFIGIQTVHIVTEVVHDGVAYVDDPCSPSIRRVLFEEYDD